jgi:hypothetical protein
LSGVLRFFKAVEAGDGGREEHLKEGEVQKIFTMSCMPLNKPTEGAININTTGTEYTINTPLKVILCEWLINYKER